MNACPLHGFDWCLEYVVLAICHYPISEPMTLVLTLKIPLASRTTFDESALRSPESARNIQCLPTIIYLILTDIWDWGLCLKIRVLD